MALAWHCWILTILIGGLEVNTEKDVSFWKLTFLIFAHRVPLHYFGVISKEHDTVKTKVKLSKIYLTFSNSFELEHISS